MQNLTILQLAKLIDISAVRTDSTCTDVEKIIEAAKKYRFICAFSLTSFLPLVIEQLKNDKDIKVGGVVAFPSGGELTAFKVEQAKYLKTLGCNEIDMVLNVGMLKSKMNTAVAQDIEAVVKAVSGTPLKVILETPLLEEEEIVRGTKIIRDAGASFVKTGTGWSGVTTFKHIELIKATIGDVIPIKVAGGVRDVDMLLKMVDMGVSRFGIGYRSAIEIMEAYTQRL